MGVNKVLLCEDLEVVVAASRSSAVRRLASALAARFGVLVEARYDSAQWTLEWGDGFSVKSCVLNFGSTS
ncbi:hypothetical protein ACIBHX_46925 [Nonomuraea sp. NPDC050536]|uniref:hypothetical protein n=1 Tax=Nonomuraea sp. NPDC050536 TaxID=3364366 RepID=UPI0037C72559